MAYVDFLSTVHKSTKRDYVARVTEFPKAEAARLAKKWDVDYWDGDRKTGYGGYRYDGRWRKVADAMVQHYGIRPGDRILDVGCGKGFILYDFLQAVPGVEVVGIDVSGYAIDHAKEEVKPFLYVANATELPFPDKSFDLVLSINTLHNLYCHDLHKALKEIVRVGCRHQYVCVESYRSEEEKVNLLYWQFTCEMFCTPREWQWWFDQTGYRGDHSFIYFE
jgi:protein-L-isoaspartate(D-aspartate) O-methyltransferase